jgi:hypothetical protein
MIARLCGNRVGSVGGACVVARLDLEHATYRRLRITRPTAREGISVELLIVIAADALYGA